MTSQSTIPAGRIDALLRVTGRLIAVLHHEVEMLRSMRVSEISRLHDEKMALTQAYEEGVNALAADPSALEAVAPAVRAELKALAARFDEAVSENARALQVVRDSHDRLLKAIVDAVAEKRARGKGYGANGSFDRRRNTRTAPSLSLSLDRKL